MSLFCQEERLLNCDSCYEITAEFCDPININPGLSPDSTYYLQIINSHVQRYYQEVTINEDGSFDVDKDLLPDSFFNPYAGKFELYLSTTEAGTDFVEMTFGTASYNCIILTIEITDTSECC